MTMNKIDVVVVVVVVVVIAGWDHLKSKTHSPDEYHSIYALQQKKENGTFFNFSIHLFFNRNIN